MTRSRSTRSCSWSRSPALSGARNASCASASTHARLKSAEGALASLRSLLGKAKTIGQVLQVERE
ncbi:hypothetical protein AB0K48_60255, partial [Nonomuraea sp. NPDC055795]